MKLREAARADPRDLAMVDLHLLWGPRPSESAKLKIRYVKINDTYIVVNIPQTKTIYRKCNNNPAFAGKAFPLNR